MRFLTELRCEKLRPELFRLTERLDYQPPTPLTLLFKALLRGSLRHAKRADRDRQRRTRPHSSSTWTERGGPAITSAPTSDRGEGWSDEVQMAKGLAPLSLARRSQGPTWRGGFPRLAGLTRHPAIPSARAFDGMNWTKRPPPRCQGSKSSSPRSHLWRARREGAGDNSVRTKEALALEGQGAARQSEPP